MAEVTVARHSISDYVHDRLTQAGVDYAISQKERFSGRKIVVCSPKIRAKQTVEALGYSEFEVDDRLTEFEAPHVQAQTASEYVLKLHDVCPEQMIEYGQRLLAAMRHYGKKHRALFISHNAIMSAAFLQISGEIKTFNHLESFRASVK